MNQANYQICTRVLSLNEVCIFLCEMNAKFWYKNMAGILLMHTSTSRQNRISKGPFRFQRTEGFIKTSQSIHYVQASIGRNFYQLYCKVFDVTNKKLFCMINYTVVTNCNQDRKQIHQVHIYQKSYRRLISVH